MDKIRREKFIFTFVVFALVMSAWLIPFITQAGAQSTTTKFKMVSHMTKVEIVPAGDEKGHVLGIVVRGGVALFENGEVATVTAVLPLDGIVGKTGTFDTYTTTLFSDGSTWVTKTKGTIERSPDGKSAFTKQTGEFVKGTGKYEGIKGTFTLTGTQYGPSEVGKGDWIGEGTATYTLPSK